VVGFGLRNVADIGQTLQEVLHVLKPGATFVSLDTAVVRWAVLKPCWNLYMNTWVPLLGWLLADSKDMYRYLFESSEHFLQPAELQRAMDAAGYQHTGFAYRPRFLGGAALVWGQKPD
jgi:ubiquinone/menaquinone biosynthesis C-methylase UbiE